MRVHLRDLSLSTHFNQPPRVLIVVQGETLFFGFISKSFSPGKYRSTHVPCIKNVTLCGIRAIKSGNRLHYSSQTLGLRDHHNDVENRAAQATKCHISKVGYLSLAHRFQVALLTTKAGSGQGSAPVRPLPRPSLNSPLQKDGHHMAEA